MGILICFVLFFLSVIQILTDVYISWIENVQYLNERQHVDQHNQHEIWFDATLVYRFNECN